MQQQCQEWHIITHYRVPYYQKAFFSCTSAIREMLERNSPSLFGNGPWSMGNSLSVFFSFLLQLGPNLLPITLTCEGDV
jgi:hypothetical protein